MDTVDSQALWELEGGTVLALAGKEPEELVGETPARLGGQVR